jgi:hypothetical protein
MLRADPGSFRDPASHVVFEGQRVLRLLDERGLAAWHALAKTDFHRRATADGRLIPAELLERPPGGAIAALEHPRVPFVSYPYEWTFSMLRDAALLQLDLLAEALAEGITIKDATPFNIQFIEGRPVFIDIGSFEEYRSGEPWIGYRQFTRQFLFPLMLRSWAGVPFQPWLRGDMEGPTAADMRHILSLGKRLRPAALMHVSLQARMEQRLSGAEIRKELATAGFSDQLILANVRKLKKLVTGLTWAHDTHGWVEYESYRHVSRDREAKADFLRKALATHRPQRVLDLGANDAYFSEVAHQFGTVAIAVDGDEPVLDAVYRRGSRVCLVISDLNNPSPAQGWEGAERPGLAERADPDLVVAYGLIHHLIYTASIPPARVLAWLAGFGCPVLIEFVAPDDEMVAKLTANKVDDELHRGRTRAEFEELVDPLFDVVAGERLGEGSRYLYSLVPH